MKFLRKLISYISRLIHRGSTNYPRRLPRDFVPEFMPPKSGDLPDQPHEHAAPEPFISRQESEAGEAPLTADGIGRMLVAKGIIKPSDLTRAIERQKQEPAKYLGQILVEMGLPQSKIIKEIYYANKRKKVGEILVELNVITKKQLYEAISEQKQLKISGTHVYLAKLMINNRLIREEHYLNALSAHFSMPVVSLKDHLVIPARQKAVGERYALNNRIIVLDDEDDVAVAIAEPNLDTFENLEKAIPRGKNILFHLARAAEIDCCLQAAYSYGDI